MNRRVGRAGQRRNKAFDASDSKQERNDGKRGTYIGDAWAPGFGDGESFGDGETRMASAVVGVDATSVTPFDIDRNVREM